MPKLSSNDVGVAGEYLVAAQLTLRGWLATVTLKNSPGIDVLAQFPGDGTLVAVQAKTMMDGKGFLLRAKDEELPVGSARLHDWFVLVNIRDAPHESDADDVMRARDVDYYVVPRSLASALIYCAKEEWLAEPGRGGRKRKKNPMRVIQPGVVTGYKDAWGLLHKPAAEAHITLGPWASGVLERFGRTTDKALLDRLRPSTAHAPGSPSS